ncbi:histidine phosphatase family protein [Nesterenkonia muleiensis]|uniref:histidine phosphatase family protein n=1 Tax=Nesterenkonia muleiensis TaxID=2282648 RepID=UPI000E773539|nr:histidine phosphatase family protein [Nesterenkonia muleiensis]
MTVRHLYLARHGDADAFGELTGTGREQSRLLGERLSAAPIDVIWHSPLPRAEASAGRIAQQLGSAPLIEAPELIDHVPYVPASSETPQSWTGFFDGYDRADAEQGQRIAESLTRRFGGIPPSPGRNARRTTHEVLVTHSYPIAWLLRHALDSPPGRWLGLNSANAALTLIEHRSHTPATIVMFNDMSHLPPELRWTGFPEAIRP